MTLAKLDDYSYEINDIMKDGEYYRTILCIHFSNTNDPEIFDVTSELFDYDTVFVDRRYFKYVRSELFVNYKESNAKMEVELIELEREV